MLRWPDSPGPGGDSISASYGPEARRRGARVAGAFPKLVLDEGFQISIILSFLSETTRFVRGCYTAELDFGENFQSISAKLEGASVSCGPQTQ